LRSAIKNYIVDIKETTFNKYGGYNFTIENPEGININDINILFNVKGRSFSFTSSSFNIDNYKEKIIWNFPDATEVKYSSIDVYGLIIAPNAQVELKYGNSYGRFIVKSFETEGVSINGYNFNGCIPNITSNSSKVEKTISATTKTTTTTNSSEETNIRPIDNDVGSIINGPYRNETICDDINIEKKEINADIVFIFDESASMCTYIEALRNKLQDFINELNNANANAKFAIIGFGGKPRIYSTFTSNISDVKNAFDKLNCQQGGQESGLEAIRMFLNKSDKFLNSNNMSFKYDTTELAWRDNSSKTIILVTDEDSDLPTYDENRNYLQRKNLQKSILIKYYYDEILEKSDADNFIGFPYYLDARRLPSYNEETYMEPSFSPAYLGNLNGYLNFYRIAPYISLGEPYQKEVDETAELLIKDNIQLFMLLNDNLAESQGPLVSNSQYNINNPLWKYLKYRGYELYSDDSSTITSQYGNPLLDSVSNTNYTRDSILSKLVDREQEYNLQGQILANKGFCRAFNIKDFVKEDSEELVKLFYKTVVTTVQSCKVVRVPVTSIDNYVCLTGENDSIYGIVSTFDVFCLDEISAAYSFSITGRIAAKNEINIGSVTINDSYDQDCSKHNFKYAVYTDKLTMGDGQIHGGIHYGTIINIKDYQKDDLLRNNCAISNESSENINFNSAEKRMIELSNELAWLTPNAEVIIKV